MRTAHSAAPHLLPLAASVWLFTSSLCTASVTVSAPAALPDDANRTISGGCPAHSYLRARLRGARDIAIDWHGAVLQCAGGARPDGRGFRITFAGPLAGGHHLRLVFGLAAPLRAGISHEVPVNLTLIFEGERRLYSTRGEGQCTIDSVEQHSLPRKVDGQPAMQVSARGFCIGPASALVGGTGGVGGQSDELLLSRFDFKGVVSAATAAGQGRDRCCADTTK